MNLSASPREIYTDRLAARTRKLAELTRRRDNIGTLRLLVFLAAVAILWFAVRGPLSLWTLIAPAALFIALMVIQSAAERGMECTRRAIKFYEQGIARLENRWQGKLGPDGARFLDPHHPYAIDLDLFGRASLFELLSTARTPGGEARLAAWLRGPAAVDELREELRARHDAIAELRPLLDLREQIAILGADCHSGVDPDRLVQWAAAPARPFPRVLRIAAFVLSLVTVSLLLLWLGTENADARLALIVFGLIGALIGVPLRARTLSIAGAVAEPARDLDLYSQILAALEARQFASPRLSSLRAAIATQDQPASRRITRLRRLMDMLDSRENPIVRAISPLVLWTTQIAMAVESWRAENGVHVPAWLDAIAEIEALSSLANYAWEHPEDPFPELTEGEPLFEGVELGHPLLAADVCVRNTIHLAPPLRLLVVSGSNMSGKSTLLRTIGVNTVLAFAGAPVRATKLTISLMSLGASIRTVDSLEQGYSRFMAEILRLKQILDLTPPALFLLDELLGGTNSHDRAIGSEGLIRALLEQGAAGLVTTHDLSLAAVAKALGPAAANVHFEDRLEGGKLVFDYVMRSGIVARSNALDLMRAVGLDV